MTREELIRAFITRRDIALLAASVVENGPMKTMQYQTEAETWDKAIALIAEGYYSDQERRMLGVRPHE